MNKLQFTVIFVKDPPSGQYTAYLPDVPSAVADGASRAEALENLKLTMKYLSEVRHEQEHVHQDHDTDQVSTGSLEFEFA